MVGQRFAKSPRVACAGSSPVASAKSLPISNCQLPINQGGSGRILVERAIDNWQSEMFGPVAQRIESATLRRSRSHVQIVPGPPINCEFANCEIRMRIESPNRIRISISAIRNSFAGVAQRGGGASLRN